jgi:hypothetical protein
VPAVRRFRRARLPVVGGVDVLSPRVRREVDRNVMPGERVHVCLRGDLGHSLIMLDERVLIVKPGFHAGSTFGALTTSIRYAHVTAVQLHSFLLSAWLEISSPSFQGRERKRNRQPRSSDRDVYKLPNCIPMKKRRFDDYQPALRELHARVNAAHEQRPSAGAAASSIVNELTRLAELCESGVIDDAEYALAKRSLIAAVTEHPPAGADRSAA